MSKVALVTGASRGIGKAIALQMAKDGYNVVVNYTSSQESALKIVEEIKTYGVDAIAIQANVAVFSEVEMMVKQCMDVFSRIDVLVNNAGITRDNLLLRMSEADFDDVIDINLKGAFHCIKCVSKIMMKQRSGVIINMSSVIGLIGNIGQVNYSASKGGVIAMTKSVAKELASRNIRCNAVAPGFIETEMTDQLNDTIKEKIVENIPLKSLGSVDDIANCVSFLVSDKSRYITGQTIQVDGGMVV